MSTEMPDSAGAWVSAVASACDGGRGGAMLAGRAPGGGAPFRRSRSPICDLLAAEQAAQERLARRLAVRAGDERRQRLDVLREARPGRGVAQQEPAVDGVDHG